MTAKITPEAEDHASYGAGEAFYARLKDAVSCRDSAELAEFFGVTYAVASDWKRRARLPTTQPD